MTFEELQKANASIKPTDVGHGKEYAEVNQRIKAFRMLFPMGRILTKLESNENGVCIFTATVMDSDGNLLGTGTAYEKEGSTFINKTSYIENCETSAVGRALAMCGFGIDTSIASFEEVVNAKANQDEKPAKTEKPSKKAEQKARVEEADVRAKVLAYVNRHNMSAENIGKICKAYKVEKLVDLNAQQCMHYIACLEKNGGNINE